MFKNAKEAAEFQTLNSGWEVKGFPIGLSLKADPTIEINQLKQELERIETEGFGALRPIYNFYENTVANILKKQGYNAVLITDEYGNQWNEVTINDNRDNQNIVFQKSIPPKNASQETKNKYIQGLIESDFKNSPPFKDIQHLLSDKVKKYNLTEKLWDNSYTTEEKKQALKC